MKRTFCDVDGNECVNKTVQIHIGVQHHTKNGEMVGEDYYKQIEVCSECEAVLRRIMPQAFVIAHSRDEEPQMETPIAYENAMAMPSRDEVTEDMSQTVERHYRDRR